MFEHRQLSQFSYELDLDTDFHVLSVLVKGRTSPDNIPGGFYIPKNTFRLIKHIPPLVI